MSSLASKCITEIDGVDPDFTVPGDSCLRPLIKANLGIRVFSYNSCASSPVSEASTATSFYDMSHSLNSFQGGYIRDYIGQFYRGFQGGY